MHPGHVLHQPAAIPCLEGVRSRTHGASQHLPLLLPLSATHSATLLGPIRANLRRWHAVHRRGVRRPGAAVNARGRHFLS